MKRNVIETILGAVVLFVAGFFLVFSYKTADVGKVEGYTISAKFNGIGGLMIGDAVEISGVKIGSVTDIELEPESYKAVVSMSIDDKINLPDDSSAVISSEGLLGGRFLQLDPGASEDMLEEGDVINYTQSPQNLEQLLGKFIFSMQNQDKQEGQ